MLTPPNCCIQVALSINRATCCFDKSQGRYWQHRVWDSIVYFWRIASTKRHLLGTLTVTDPPRNYLFSVSSLTIRAAAWLKSSASSERAISTA
jgi:hypothetical protein